MWQILHYCHDLTQQSLLSCLMGFRSGSYIRFLKTSQVPDFLRCNISYVVSSILISVLFLIYEHLNYSEISLTASFHEHAAPSGVINLWSVSVCHVKKTEKTKLLVVMESVRVSWVHCVWTKGKEQVEFLRYVLWFSRTVVDINNLG